MSASVPSGITEADIAEYLANAPDFFARHTELLAVIELPSPHGDRAVSLHERQMALLRDRYRLLERQVAELQRGRTDMIEASRGNEEIARRMHRWTCAVMRARSATLLGQVLVEELKHEFRVPQAALRLWGVSPMHAHLPWTRDVGEDMRTFAASLSQPYCGLNQDFEAAGWLPDPAQAASLALLPLRLGQGRGEAFGLLVLASDDAARFGRDMGTEFLEQLAEIASAALGRLVSAGE